MSTKTPPKIKHNIEQNTLFSPVTLPESPAAVSPQKNLTGLPRVARDIAADVYNNIQHWNDYHVKGAVICKNISTVKADNVNSYPDGLENLTTELYDVTQKLNGVVGALEFLSSQMKSLVKLHKKATPMFISLSNQQLCDLVETIARAYQDELKIKGRVLENIAHCTDKSETMFYAVAWTYQQNVTNDTNMKLESLLTETGHRKIN